MFTYEEYVDIENALSMAIASSKRALNSSKNAQLKPIHEKIVTDLNKLYQKVIEQKLKQPLKPK
jgi:hypothetical protein